MQINCQFLHGIHLHSYYNYAWGYWLLGIDITMKLCYIIGFPKNVQGPSILIMTEEVPKFSALSQNLFTSCKHVFSSIHWIFYI